MINVHKQEHRWHGTCLCFALLTILAVLSVREAHGDPAHFRVRVVELDFGTGYPGLDMAAAEESVRDALMILGFNEHDYDLVSTDPATGMPYRIDASHVADEQAERAKSGPALAAVYDAVIRQWPDGYYYGDQRGGNLTIAITERWPSGKHHGSVAWAYGMARYRSFCTMKAIGVCSHRKDCLVHELGHMFGMEHRRHDWWGDPSAETGRLENRQIRYIRGAASCTPLDIEQLETEFGHRDEREAEAVTAAMMRHIEREHAQ